MRVWLLLLAGCDAFYGLEERDPHAEDVGIIARYPMNELGSGTTCMHDEVGGHDGACEGDALVPVASDCGSGYHFDGSATIHIGAASTFKLQAFTIVYQLRLDPATGTGMGMCPVVHVFGAGKEDSWSYCFESTQTDLTSATGTGSNAGSNGNGDALDTTQWHQIAISYGSGTMTGYIDSIPGAILPTPMVLYDNDDTVLGADIEDGTPQHTFTGSLDDLRIFNRAVPPDELGKLTCE